MRGREGRGQRAEGRGQRAEGRGQRAEGRGPEFSSRPPGEGTTRDAPPLARESGGPRARVRCRAGASQPRRAWLAVACRRWRAPCCAPTDLQLGGLRWGACVEHHGAAFDALLKLVGRQKQRRGPPAHTGIGCGASRRRLPHRTPAATPARRRLPHRTPGVVFVCQAPMTPRWTATARSSRL